MAAHQGQDPKILKEQEYADDSHLDVRYRTHQLYTVDPVNFGQWTLERLPWQGDERVLDVGCGPGAMLCEMARRHSGLAGLLGFDFSEGMVAKAMQAANGLSASFLVADAQAIPHPDSSFDVVMARHMLYHVPDIDRAVAEAARVLQPGGFFLATTNGTKTMHESAALRARAAAQFPMMIQPDTISTRFAIENAGPYLQPYFERVETHTLPGMLRFPSTQPFVDYFASARSMMMHPQHTDAEWQEILDFVRREVEAVIEREGKFDVTKITGALVGTKGS